MMNFTKISDQTMLEAAQKKTKMGAWFVSNCKTLSNREALIRNMQQHYFSVDIYGSCGTFRYDKFGLGKHTH
jgi:hypothetical protein